LAVERVEHRFQAMGGPCRLLVDAAPGAVDDALLSMIEAEVERLESRYSRYRSDSWLSRINALAGSGEAVTLDSEALGLCRYADTLWRESGGAFDPTAGVLRRAWDFRSGRLPAAVEVEALLPLIGWQAVDWSEHAICLPRPGMELDFGGLVKEYAVDSVVRRLRDSGIRCALFDMAGDLATIGSQADGRPCPVGVRPPRDTGGAVAHLTLADRALASSGDYERRLLYAGRTYSHLLDARTGWPVEGLLCASVVAPQCLVAGGAATLALLQSSSEGLRWLDSLDLPWLAVDRDLRVHGPLTGP
jgi:thiamine biosynthesis lipoprotein